ncbi:MAG TPA: hypothetical protein VEX36_12770 [Thermoleophilaceae bacterium]|nr:hypothetical protein [Thermoleophilaceae bacterium]
MRSRALIAFLVVTVVGVAVALLSAARDERDLAFTLGVAPGLVAAELGPGGVACQTPVDVAESFDGVRLFVGTFHRPGQPLGVTVRRAGRGGPIAKGRLPSGYPDGARPTVALDATASAGEQVEVCVRNLGDRRVALFGGPELAKRDSTVEIAGRDQHTDLVLEFTQESRSALAWLPEIFDRASVFRPVWVGTWTYWLLVGLVLLGAPALLARALRDAFGATDGSGDGDGSLAGDLPQSRTQA